MYRLKSWRAIVAGLGVVALAVALSYGAVRADGHEKLKVGFVYVSPIGDAGWTFQHDLARQAIVEKFGDKVETSFVESVAEGPDAERVIRQLAADGNQLIFTTSFGYMNPTIKVAKQFPKVTFAHCSGYKQADNVSTYLARFYEGRYLAGIIAGKMSKSNTLGYVAAFPIPEVVRGINAFARGVRSVNPDAEVRVVWVSSWYDPGKEREAAEVLIDQGADVLMQHTDSTAVVQAAQDRNVFAIGYHSDMAKYGPKAHLTASTHVWNQFYIDKVQAVMDGNAKSDDTWGGLGAGMVELSPLGDMVPDDVRKLVETAQGDIAGGKLHPFAGPVLDNKGETKVPEGQNISDDALLKMQYYVEGVVGDLPK
jgi:simple sugar transport system substrate-binding protein